MSEHIYILTNESIPELLKIGFTSRTPEERCAELSTSSGVPCAFQVAYSRSVSNGRSAEVAVHKLLVSFRANKSREFFQMPLPKAIAAVDYCASDYPEGEDAPSKGMRVERGIPYDFEVYELVYTGRRTKAIELCQQRYEVGFKEAKDRVDAYGVTGTVIPIAKNDPSLIRPGCLPFIALIFIPVAILVVSVLVT